MELETQEDTCRRCGSPIRWAITARNHKRIPLNPEPVENGRGNFVLKDEIMRYLHEEDRQRTIEDGKPIYETHYATCGKSRSRGLPPATGETKPTLQTEDVS